MSRQQKWLCVFYAWVAVLSLVGTWGHIASYLPPGLLQGNIQFWTDTLVNGASRFITVDIMMVFLVVWLWMATEARRLSMRGYWWYLPAALLIAFSATLPVFMIHREVARARCGESQVDKPLGLGLTLSMVVISLVSLAYLWWSFNR